MLLSMKSILLSLKIRVYFFVDFRDGLILWAIMDAAQQEMFCAAPRFAEITQKSIGEALNFFTLFSVSHFDDARQETKKNS